MACSIASPSGIFSITMIRLMRSAGEDPEKRILERHVEARAAGSPWRPERPRSWLSMRRDSWRSVPMMCRPHRLDHLVVQRLPFRCRSLSVRSFSFLGRQVLDGVDQLALLLDVAAEHDVGAAARQCWWRW